MDTGMIPYIVSALVKHHRRMRSSEPTANAGVGSRNSSRTNIRKKPVGASSRHWTRLRSWKRSRDEKRQNERSADVDKTEFIEKVAQEADVSTGEAQRYFEAFERVVTEYAKRR